MAFESNRPFGFRSGFQPGREYASPAGAMRPEMIGLDVIGEAAQQARQFPVIAGGGRGLAIPGLSQVEVAGGPSQIGNETTEDAEGLLGGVAHATRVADEPPAAGPLELAMLAGRAGQRGGVFARDLSNLSAFSGAGTPGFDASALQGLSEAQKADVLTGGTVAPPPGGASTPGGPSVIGAAGSGAAALGSLLTLLSAGGVGGKDVGLAGGSLSGVGNLAQLVELARSGNLASLGGAASGAGALGAILSLIGSQTGNEDLTLAGGALGAAGSLGSGAAAVTGAAAGGIGAANAAGAGVGGALASGSSAAGGGIAGGLSAVAAPAAVVTAPIIMFMLADLASGGKYMNEIMSSRNIGGDYINFLPDLMANQGQQGAAFNTLAQALPYVQDKGELGQLLNSYKNYLGTTQNAPTEQWGGTGPGDPYSIAKIPGVGPITHGQQTPEIDWGPQTRALQDAVDALLGVLPGERITAAYGEPGGGLEGEAAMRLWSQFLDREQNAPRYYQGTSSSMIDAFNLGPESILPAGFYDESRLASAGVSPDALTYGQDKYPYGAPGSGGFPKPGQFIGDISPYWLQLIAGAGMAPANTPGRALVAA